LDAIHTLKLYFFNNYYDISIILSPTPKFSECYKCFQFSECFYLPNRSTNRILVGMPEGRRPLERSRRRWVHNIKMDLREIGWDGMDWIDLAQNRDRWRVLVNMVMNLRVP
jgi:hypothetical protein